MSEYFPKTKYFGRIAKVELDFSNYATKADLMMLIHEILLKRLI